MSPLKYNGNEYASWYPKSPKNNSINFNHRNEDKRIAHTVRASANTK